MGGSLYTWIMLIEILVFPAIKFRRILEIRTSWIESKFVNMFFLHLHVNFFFPKFSKSLIIIHRFLWKKRTYFQSSFVSIINFIRVGYYPNANYNQWRFASVWVPPYLIFRFAFCQCRIAYWSIFFNKFHLSFNEIDFLLVASFFRLKMRDRIKLSTSSSPFWAKGYCDIRETQDFRIVI